MSDEVTTLTVQGEGGHVFEMDVPSAGTMRRETFDEMLEKGTLKVIDGKVPDTEPEPEPVSDVVAAALELVGEVPDGNADEVLDWAEDDPDRQLAALMVEQGDGGKGRKGVVESLTSDLENDEG